MPGFRVLLLIAVALTSAVPAFSQTPPAHSGVVTNVGTPAAFTVDAILVRCTATTQNFLKTKAQSTQVSGCPARYVGEEVTVYGKLNGKAGTVDATEIDAEARTDTDVGGFAVVDRIETSTDTKAAAIVSADGYRITVPASIHSVFLAPLTSQTTIATNLWLRYSGVQHADGSVTAKSATFSANELKERERKANTKKEFDPAAVTESQRQGVLSKAFRGVDPKRFPATHDLAMQQRVESIGAKLIPAFERELPANDPSKIDFRFQVVDQPKFRDAETLSNGIILVPQQVVVRLENDSQLATVLADNIACALEKQDLRLIPARRTMAASDIALGAGGFFVPGLGLATLVTDGTASAKMLKRTEEQSGRVSLVLLHEAGYDIAEAPKTWWILGSSKPKPVKDIPMPYRARYLYRMLATTWRTQSAAQTNLAAENPAHRGSFDLSRLQFDHARR